MTKKQQEKLAARILRDVCASMTGGFGTWSVGDTEVSSERGLLRANISSAKDDENGIEQFAYFKLVPCAAPRRGKR